MSEKPDEIIIKNLLVRNIIGVDNWERQKKQDVLINIRIETDISKAGATDSIKKTISYSTVTKEVADFAEKTQFKSVEGLAEGISDLCLKKLGIESLTIRVEKPRALLLASSAGVQIKRSISTENAEKEKENDHIFIKNLLVRTIIGVNPWERDDKQDLIVTADIWPQNPSPKDHDYVPKTHDYRTICRTLVSYLESSSFQTLEALSTSLAEVVLFQSHARKVTLNIEKPSALLLAQSAGVKITRFQNQLQRPSHSDQSTQHKSHISYISLGSNLGERANNISQAIDKLVKDHSCTLLDTSFLYETSPVHIKDQPKFLNAVCKVRTTLSPTELLNAVKKIEENMGRTETIRYGPRIIDMDILFYDDLELKTNDLEIPHPRIQERNFVLRPLCDITKSLEHPKLQKTSFQLLSHLRDKDQVVEKVLPIGNSTWKWGQKTIVMGVLNITQDSFSDGGEFLNPEDAIKKGLELSSQGASIVDVGGVSTKPNAQFVSEEEELQRVIPVVQKLTSSNLLVSVDTFRAAVARKAAEAGVHMINDVTGGSSDPEMYKTLAELNLPVCFMHTRGDTQTMTKLKDYENDDIVGGIQKELGEKIVKAIENGVKRWNIIIDPGFGFAKHPHHSLYLLNHLQELIAPGKGLENFPILAGPSRKGFIGFPLNQPDPKQRVWGTAAACSALIASKADILRVHDVKEMMDVVQVSDAIWRNQS